MISIFMMMFRQLKVFGEGQGKIVVLVKYQKSQHCIYFLISNRHLKSSPTISKFFSRLILTPFGKQKETPVPHVGLFFLKSCVLIICFICALKSCAFQ